MFVFQIFLQNQNELEGIGRNEDENHHDNQDLGETDFHKGLHKGRPPVVHTRRENQTQLLQDAQ